MFVELRMLTKHGACINQKRAFASAFGNGVKVTKERCITYASTFDWKWAIECLIIANIDRPTLREKAKKHYFTQDNKIFEWYDLLSNNNDIRHMDNIRRIVSRTDISDARKDGLWKAEHIRHAKRQEAIGDQLDVKRALLFCDMAQKFGR